MRYGIGGDRELTVPLSFTARHWPSASQPRIRDSSWTRVFVSRTLVLAERRRESLARRHGWVEMWTLEGRFGDDMAAVFRLGREI